MIEFKPCDRPVQDNPFQSDVCVCEIQKSGSIQLLEYDGMEFSRILCHVLCIPASRGQNVMRTDRTSGVRYLPNKTSR